MWVSVDSSVTIEINTKGILKREWIELPLEALHPEGLRCTFLFSQELETLKKKLASLETFSTHIRIPKYPDFPNLEVQIITPTALKAPTNFIEFRGLNENSKEILKQFLGRMRKQQHIDLCENDNVESSSKKNGFEAIKLPSLAVVDGKLSDIDLSTTFLKQKFSLPFLISGMTGGIEKASFINHSLARVACDLSIPMGVGSQRVALEDENLSSIFRLKPQFPSLFLIANLGIAQLRSKQFGIDAALKCIEMIQADAIAIHVNILQELVQSEGDRDFTGSFLAIETLVTKSPVPVILKEVGCGIDSNTSEKLFELGIRCFDAGGSGGTSWSYIESKRSAEAMQKRVGLSFRDWGTPTAEVVTSISAKYGKQVEIIASGGMRSGIDAAKALACGASMVGFALPLLRAVLKGGSQMAKDEINIYAQELKICTFLSGAKNLSDWPGRYTKI